jgi:hypothetical protein
VLKLQQLGFTSLALSLATMALSLPTCSLAAQQPTRSRSLNLESTPPRHWVEAAAVNEEHIIDDDGNFPLRYRTRKVDAKSDTTREIIETRQGSVARLIQRNGQPITAAEDALERDRLNAMLASPSDFIKHHKHDSAARGYSMALVRKLPDAMSFTYVPGQPQPAYASSLQVVIDFTPNPAFKPSAMIENVLTGIEGRVWIDAESLRVTRIEAHVLRPVDFGWGMLARIYPGGSVEFEQANAGGDRWAYSHVSENLTIREMMVKTSQQRQSMDAGNFQILPAPVTYQEAVHMLLATQIPLR